MMCYFGQCTKKNVLSVHLRFTASDNYPIGIYKLFFNEIYHDFKIVVSVSVSWFMGGDISEILMIDCIQISRNYMHLGEYFSHIKARTSYISVK